MLDSCGLSPQQGVPFPSASSPVRPQAASSAARVLSLHGRDPRYQPGRGLLEAVRGKKKWSHYTSTQTCCHIIFSLCKYDSVHDRDPRYQPGRGLLEAVCGKKKWSHYTSTQTCCHIIFSLCKYDSVHDRDPRYQPGRGLLEAVSGKKKMVALHLNSNIVPHYFFHVQI